MIWVTSDTHFGHSNILKYCDRPYSSVEEMDAALIRNWNQLISPSDVVYHLGDFTLRKSADEYLQQLNGMIRIIPGSHDYWIKKFCMEQYHGRVEILPLYYSIHSLGKRVVLCHYPMISWEASYHGSYHLHGHTHGHLDNTQYRYDVGVDSNNMLPIHLGALIGGMMLLNEGIGK